MVRIDDRVNGVIEWIEDGRYAVVAGARTFYVTEDQLSERPKK